MSFNYSLPYKRPKSTVSYFYILDNNLEFLLRKISKSTFSGFKLALFVLTISPATENTCSAGTEVAGTQRYCVASLARFGYV